jgi:diguanylate cyclase (GGDEF)-like protein
MAVTRLHDDAGIDWLTVVAVPRSDLMGDVLQSIWLSLLIVFCLAVVVLIVGFVILNWITNDLRRIHLAALKLAQWQKATPINIRPRNDEIGQLAKSFELMEQGLMHDNLSGLLNREAFSAKANRRITAETATPCALLFLDLNLFKQVNDKLGHAAGDQVLHIAAQRLAQAVRDTDYVARFGGDEFVVMAHNVASPQALAAIKQKILQAIEQVIVLDSGDAVHISTAIGAAIFPRDGEDLDTLLHKADADMYAQKRARSAV